MSIGIAFAYNTGASRRLKICDRNLNLLFTGTTALTNVYLAVNRSKGFVYACEANVLKGRNSAGSLLYTEFESVGAQRPLFVDGESKLWTVDDTTNNVVRRWNSDLSSRIDYTLKVGNYLQDKVDYVSMSYDKLSVVLLGGSSHKRVAKYLLTNLDGGEPEWTYDTNSLTVTSVFFDSSGNVYTCGYSSGGGILRKLNSSGVSQWAKYGHGSFFSVVGSKIFTIATNPDGVIAGSTKQLNISDGSYVGRTDTVINPLTFTVHLYDSNAIFVGHTETPYGGNENGIYKYNITDDLGDGDVETASILYPGKHCYAYGDCTGYLNDLLTLPISSFKLLYRENLTIHSKLPTSRIDLDDEGYLKIVEDLKLIEHTGTLIGSVHIQKDNDFRINPIVTNNTIKVNETNFIVKEVDNDNLSVKPESTTVELNKKTEDIILNQDIWR